MIRRVSDLDKEILRIQSSTRTSFRFFTPIHDWLRLHNRLYYLWSTRSYSRIFHWTFLLLYIAALPTLYFVQYSQPQNVKAITYDFPRWESINPKPTGNNLSKVVACPNDEVFSVGAGGTILKSTDDGVTYSQEYTGIANDLYSIACYSQSNIVAVGASGQILNYNGHSWTSRAVGLTNQNLLSVVLSSTGQFVIVGDNGTILYSTDGQNWSIEDAGLTTQSLNNVIITSTGQFVIVGDNGTILYSTDGQNWSIEGGGITAQPLYGLIVSSTGKYVATGGNGTILYSSDGQNWSLKAAGLVTRYLWSVAVSSTGQFVAVSDAGDIIYSPDGQNWAKKGIGLTTNTIGSVTVSSTGQFVAVGFPGVILYSADGQNWSIKGAGLTHSQINCIFASSTGQFSAVGVDGVILYSTDGQNWSLKQTSVTDDDYNDIVVSSTGQFVAVGFPGNILYSTDEQNWSIKAAGLTTYPLFRIAVSSTNHFVAVGGSGTILYSADGQNWSIEAVSLTNQTLLGVAVSPTGQFVAVGMNGTILYSTDGQNWSIKAAGLTTYVLSDVAVSGTGQFVAVSYNGDILYSADGQNWSIKNAGLTVNYLQRIAVSSTGQFVVVGGSGTILYSADGQNWSIKNSDLTAYDIHYVIVSGTGQFVAVGDNGTILYSADGQNWSIKGAGITTNTLSSVDVSGTSQFVAVGDNGIILYSADGQNWSIKGAGITTQSLSIVAVSGTGQFVTLGGNGTILRYYTPTNATATKLQVALPGQSFEKDTGVYNPPGYSAPTVKVGDTVPVNIYAVDDSNKLDPSNASTVAFTTTDPNDSNPPSIQLTPTSCDQTSLSPCGNGTTNFTFHTPGTWTITTSDINGALSSATTVPITVYPGNPKKPYFKTIPAANPKTGQTSAFTLGLADLFGNATSDNSTARTVHLISSSPTAEFSASPNGPWTNSLDYTFPAGETTIDPASNPTFNFYYLNFSAGTSTITVSGSGLDNATQNITTIQGQIYTKESQGSLIDLDPNSITAGASSTVTVTLNAAAPSDAANRTITLYSSLSDKSVNQTIISNLSGTASVVIHPTISGSHVVRAKVSDPSGDIWLESAPTLTVSSDKIAKINLSADTDVAAGTSLNVVANFLDQYSNIATNSRDTIRFSSSDSDSILPGNYTLTSSDSGEHTFSGIILKSSGKQTITLTDQNTNTSNSISFNVASSNLSLTQSTLTTNKSSLSFGNQIGSTISNITNALRQSAAAKAVANAAKNVATAAAALGLIPIIASILGSAPAAVHAIAYGFSLSMEALGIRRKRKNWGRVFDSTTGKGVDLALVRLYNRETMKLKGTIITDIQGKYYFQIEPGSYVITVSHEDYIFPTQIFVKYGVSKIDKTISKTNNQYVGQTININNGETLLNIDIPIDPTNKKASFFLRSKIALTSLFETALYTFSYIFIPVLIIGSLLSVFTAIIMPDQRNIILAVIYFILSSVYIISRMIKNRQFSQVTDKTTKKPIPEVAVSLFDKEYNTLKETRITDRFGRFSIFAQPGEYYLKAEKDGYRFSTEKEPKEKKINPKKTRGRSIYQGELIKINEPSFINVIIDGEGGK